MRALGQRFSLLLGMLGATSLGCPSRESVPVAETRGRHPRSSALDPNLLAQDRATVLRALSLPYHRVAQSLGAHRLTCTTTLVTRVPHLPPREAKQEVQLLVDAEGHFQAIKNTHPQYGSEVVSMGDWLYPRLRYGKFLRRRPSPGEPQQILDRLASAAPAYVALLRPFIDIAPLGKEKHLGREAVRVKLVLSEARRRTRTPSSPARQWRRTVAAKTLEGLAVLEATSGAPLEVKLRASWSFHPPAPGPLPATGIPSATDQSTVGTMELTLAARVSDLGTAVRIQRPPEAETVDNPRLVRPEIERQLLTGELPFPDPPSNGSTEP